MGAWKAGKFSNSRSQPGEREGQPNVFGPNRTQGISWKAIVFAVVFIGAEARAGGMKRDA